jgi:hypothetical protein
LSCYSRIIGVDAGAPNGPEINCPFAGRLDSLLDRRECYECPPNYAWAETFYLLPLLDAVL